MKRSPGWASSAEPPTSEGAKGRDHDHYGFTTCSPEAASAAVCHGSTDRFGLVAVENRVHVHDLARHDLALDGFWTTRS